MGKFNGNGYHYYIVFGICYPLQTLVAQAQDRQRRRLTELSLRINFH